MRGRDCVLAPVLLAVLLKVAQCQIFMIKNAQLEKCVHAADDTGRVSLAKCKVESHHQYWSWKPSSRSIVNLKSGQCLTVVKLRDLPTLKVDPCEGKKNQAWHCDSHGHLSIFGHSLYLSAKQGTKKVLLARGADKFSKWKTLMDLPICGEMVTTTTISEAPSSDLNTQYHGAETSHGDEYRNGSVMPGTAPMEATTTWEPAATYSTESVGYAFTEEVQSASWERIYVFEENSIGWKTAMLILSPFTFLLGVVIVALNVRVNKKRKLAALPNHTNPHHKLGSPCEKSPLNGKIDPADDPGPYASSSTLRHGEILIEWKDGTITPLYDLQ
ncbi:uncharacterized protein PAF06_019400 [Gastrophryne carolinensis]